MSNAEIRLNKIFDKAIIVAVLMVITAFAFAVPSLYSQNLANPANWLYQDGNAEATKYVKFRSVPQSFDSMTVKWSTKAIYGDITPLIGNIINNPTLRPNFNYSPNEMTAVVGNKIIVVDGRGKIFESIDLTKNGRFNFINGVSVLMDTLLTEFTDDIRSQVVLGLETIETDRSKIENPDTLALAYIAGFNDFSSEPEIIKRMAIDMRQFGGNYSASVKPVFGWNYNNKFSIYAQVSSANPTVPSNFDPFSDPAPYFRGIIQFDADIAISNFPLNDIGYDPTNVLTMGPNTSFAVPSIASFQDIRTSMLVPIQEDNSFSIEMPSQDVNGYTYSNESYLYRAVFDNEDLEVNLNEQISDFVNGTQSFLRPYTVELWDPDFSQFRQFILLSEQYSGVDGSFGTSYLHLFDNDEGLSITKPGSTPPPYKGGENQMWSVAVGNLDGNNDNSLEPFYPNNPGVEIIATNSSKEFSVAQSKIHVLKYNGFSNLIPKTSPPNTFLYDLDTICTQQINGWVAAVNDLDGDPQRKDEILLVNGSRIMVLQMRDYESFEFRSGDRFDTLHVQDFPGETISNAQIADLEGDGKNDIIVTTFKATHVIGIPLDDVLDVLAPFNLGTQICVGDEVEIKWENFVVNDKDVEILFQEITDMDTIEELPILIADSINNFNDTVSYAYTADSTLVGKRGFFIVRVMESADQIIDASGIVVFNLPSVDLITSNMQSNYRVGEEIEFTGLTFCYDSLEVEFRTNSSDTWTSVLIDNEQSSDTFTLSTFIPCMDIFSCTYSVDGIDVDYRITSHKSEFSASATYTTKLLPSKMEIEVDTMKTASPAKLFSWNATDFEYECDSLTFLFSTSEGRTFTMVETIDAGLESYQWNTPINLPDTVLVRICCEGSCLGIDTVITGTQVNSIKMVAPNPFRPPFEEAMIIYSLEEDANVTISILDQGNRVVAVPVSNQMRYANIAYTDYWDGRLRSKQLAANGLYYIRLELSSGKTEIYPIFVRK